MRLHMKFLVYNILFGFIKTYGEFLLCEQFITLLYEASIKKIMPGPKIILAHKRGEKNVRHHQQTITP